MGNFFKAEKPKVRTASTGSGSGTKSNIKTKKFKPQVSSSSIYSGINDSRNRAVAAYANLDPTVNSSFGEYTPALSADGLTLLFASTRPGGLGKRDLWRCARTSLSEPFGEPVNLGPAVNSEFNEHGPSFSADGLSLLFNSDRPGGQGRGDLWMARIGQELPAEAVTRPTTD